MSDFFIAVDFDGTVSDHRYPYTGQDVPDAVPVLRELVQVRTPLILLTMRSHQERDPKSGLTTLQAAVRWFEEREIPLFGINENPTQITWTSSRKVYANMYIDDSALGCPLREFAGFQRPAVDWVRVRGLLVEHGILPAPRFQMLYTGFACSVCGAPQFTTPSGDLCRNSHGGSAPAVGPAQFPNLYGKPVTREELLHAKLPHLL